MTKRILNIFVGTAITASAINATFLYKGYLISNVKGKSMQPLISGRSEIGTSFKKVQILDKFNLNIPKILIIFKNFIFADLVLVKIVNPKKNFPLKNSQKNLKFEEGVVKRGDVVFCTHRNYPVIKRVEGIENDLIELNKTNNLKKNKNDQKIEKLINKIEKNPKNLQIDEKFLKNNKKRKNKNNNEIITKIITKIIKTIKINNKRKTLIKNIKNKIWLEGDNSAESNDSRHYGEVNANQIFGLVVFKMWPPDKFFGRVKCDDDVGSSRIRDESKKLNADFEYSVYGKSSAGYLSVTIMKENIGNSTGLKSYADLKKIIN